MKILKKLRDLFSKSNNQNNLEDIKKAEQRKAYEDLEFDKIQMLMKKYFCDDEEELVVVLIEKEMRYGDFSNDEKIFYENPEWDYIKEFAKFGFIMEREKSFGKSLAIQELIQNRYVILSDEHGNPFKEVINFTLNYFESFFLDEPNNLENVLSKYFPSMHKYIYQHITKQNTIIEPEANIDEQKAYDEFLDFCKNFFQTHYPDKSNRDLQIKNQFKILNNDLMSFIDNDQNKLQ